MFYIPLVLFVIALGYDSRIVIFREIIAAGVFAKVDIRLTEFSRFGRQRNNRSADYGKIAVVIRIVRDDFARSRVNPI